MELDSLDLSNDFWEPDYSSDIYESVQGNSKILGRWQGQMFVPDGKSRNRRFYTESLWRKVLADEEVQRTLKNGMLGTLLHPTDEKMAHPIYSSHVIKKLWIDGKKGLGEAYIIDTPVGRIIDTFKQSKLIEIFTSTRAFGKLAPGKKIEGLPVVDENNYYFRTVDFVLDPGFLECSGKFTEGVERTNVSKVLETLSECFVSNVGELGFTKIEHKDRAKRLLEDIKDLF